MDNEWIVKMREFMHHIVNIVNDVGDGIRLTSQS